MFACLLQALPLGNREPVILSVGQFRPEKDHPLQIRAFAKLIKSGGVLPHTLVH